MGRHDVLRRLPKRQGKWKVVVVVLALPSGHHLKPTDTGSEETALGTSETHNALGVMRRATWRAMEL